MQVIKPPSLFLNLAPFYCLFNQIHLFHMNRLLFSPGMAQGKAVKITTPQRKHGRLVTSNVASQLQAIAFLFLDDWWPRTLRSPRTSGEFSSSSFPDNWCVLLLLLLLLQARESEREMIVITASKSGDILVLPCKVPGFVFQGNSSRWCLSGSVKWLG